MGKTKKIPLSDARHPARMKAIRVLETIAEMKGKENMFDGEQWYAYEDAVTNIIAEEVKT